MQLAEILRSNTSLQKLKCDQNLISTLGIIRILDSLKVNKSLVKLQAENNKMTISRRFLAVVGDLVIYHNKTLRQLILTCYANIAAHLGQPSQQTSHHTNALTPKDKEMLAEY